MDSCKKFTREHPLLLAALTFFGLYGLLKLVNLLPDMPLSFGIREAILAVAVYAITYVLMGKEKVAFTMKGIGYGFWAARSYFIIMTVVVVLCFAAISSLLYINGESYQLVPFLNAAIGCLFVGVAEEFTFRGLIFGGLLQKLGNSKKGIILASVISGLLFGVLHVFGSALNGEIADAGAVATAFAKTIQCAIFGFVLAFIYYKTRNLFVAAALHSLDDFMIICGTGAGLIKAESYVSSTNVLQHLAVYAIFTVVVIPSLIKSTKDITEGEAIPFDDDFLPRNIAVQKKAKKEKKQKKSAH